MLDSTPLHVVPSETEASLTASIPIDLDTIQDFEGIKERFSTGFKAFVESHKRQALMELLEDEMPSLAKDENFVERVLEKMDHSIFTEERYVFLSVNPKFQLDTVH